jgi:hypothetical protein
MLAQLVLTALLCTSCVGTLYSERNPKIVDGAPFEGILYFQPVPIVVTYETRQLVQGEAKKLVGSAPDGCAPVRTQKIEKMPDYSTAYRLYYEPGPFESGKFSVTLEGGVLKTVNSEYTPGSQQLVDLTKATAELVSAISPAGVVGEVGGKPACNAGTVIVGLGSPEELDDTN